ncbi:unnamed protein product [Tilletia controversa]|uniref:Uncharacterized protein n=3 Tax=Tilletia TaxID=13289 RepID=A0A8X7MQM9_9BASI|nr:hypothetical protein CF336_g4917 [Tilletia laevis]KAE8194896.1 hypothetical protein CF328_g4604 [Tilletia controversa]KAE8258818.1 hypothetical protein A4X03_0g4270 [Tilletia caries]KAE8199017.1 hypothetical protein CF335_g4258 [Tilletia laevis]KAE8245885.1 hypothetical protein A4X06_0g5355 [Tilletia controversa]
MLHLSNTKYNAVGLLPEHSMALPERDARPDELAIIKAIYDIWTAEPTESTWSVFSEEVTYTRPNGTVAIGLAAFRELFAHFQQRNPSKQLQQRILTTPEMFSSSTTIVLDHAMPAMPEQSTSDAVTALQSLVVVRRRANDGLVTSITEEEGHKKAIAPLAARAAVAQNFNSPTDKMVSPCTSKLNLVKKKHFTKAKPTSLFASQTGARTHSALSSEMPRPSS